MPFKPGRSGNPSGRPKLNKELVELAKEATPEAWARIKQIMRQQKDMKLAFQAALAVIERGYGKPKQAVEMTGAEGGPIQTENISDAEAARRIAFALAQGVNDKDEEKKEQTLQ